MWGIWAHRLMMAELLRNILIQHDNTNITYTQHLTIVCQQLSLFRDTRPISSISFKQVMITETKRDCLGKWLNRYWTVFWIPLICKHLKLYQVPHQVIWYYYKRISPSQVENNNYKNSKSNKFSYYILCIHLMKN